VAVQDVESSILLGGVEAGGTKFNCVIGTGPGDIRSRAHFPTTTPAETLAQVQAFFEAGIKRHGELQALGIATFGPADLNKASETYGYITSTPKAGWSYTNMAGLLGDALAVPVGFETDVNGAALGEGLYGAAKGLMHYVYVTIGTGIGAGVVVNGNLLNGATHPEVGHMLMPQEPAVNGFEGNCPFHKNCLEGVAAGPAIKARWGVSGDQLEESHPAWLLQAHYLAVMCVNLTLCYAPERIVLGGGVMGQAHLFPMIREKFAVLMNGYQKLPHLQDLDSYIVPTPLQGMAGELGALELARKAYKGEQ